MKYIVSLILIHLISFSAFSKCNPKKYNFSDYQVTSVGDPCRVRPGDLVDFCNGEVCGYLAYPKAIRDVKLYSKPDLNSRVVGEIKRCDVIKNFKHKSVFKKFGEAEVQTDILGLQLKKGDIIKFAWTQDETYFGCVKNHPFSFDAVPAQYAKESCFVHKTSSEAEEWIFHTASNGKSGFSKVEPDSFYVGYSGSNERCPGDEK